MAKRIFWKRGQMAELARRADISPQQMSDILHRRRPVGKHLALKLSKSLYRMKKQRVPAIEWLFNRTSKHPAFFNRRKRRGI